MLIKWILSISLIVIIKQSFAQERPWQQWVEYTMDVKLDVGTHRLTGRQKLIYYNNSNDTLSKIYYHLYFNAFQPGSMMDVRSRTIADPDPRIGDRILHLTPDEQGYQRVKRLLQDGQPTVYRDRGTILEVSLSHPLLPHSSTSLVMEFEAQVPIQIRRSGRDSREGIAYSMTQWYPKLAEYDFEGWHIDPYVAREFHGVWGDYSVNITIDPSFTVAGTGVLQNPDSIGHGYQAQGVKAKRARNDITWRFVARNVHDFAWAADPDYKHLITQVPDGPEIHLFYKESKKTTAWDSLPELAVKVFQFNNSRFGKYPFDTYSIIQGGDGGMEYPMCTLIAGEGKLTGLAGTMFHEVSHSWFQMALATNESEHAWMDEGFAQFAEYEALSDILDVKNKYEKMYTDYAKFALAGKEEPMAQFSDYFTTNVAYKFAAYYKGCILLNQLRYLIGEDHFWKGMTTYYDTWKFRHPSPTDFMRIMEKISGMQLKWYFNYWVSTTKQIDYRIRNAELQNDSTAITLQRKGEMPMPIDLLVEYKDGSKEIFYIPLNEMYGGKDPENSEIKWTRCKAWNWVNPNYVLVIRQTGKRITSIQIDPSGRMADVHPSDNRLELEPGPE
jgi:Peptidase family M1 domain